MYKEALSGCCSLNDQDVVVLGIDPPSHDAAVRPVLSTKAFTRLLNKDRKILSLMMKSSGLNRFSTWLPGGRPTISSRRLESVSRSYMYARVEASCKADVDGLLRFISRLERFGVVRRAKSSPGTDGGTAIILSSPVLELLGDSRDYLVVGVAASSPEIVGDLLAALPYRVPVEVSPVVSSFSHVYGGFGEDSFISIRSPIEADVSGMLCELTVKTPFTVVSSVAPLLGVTDTDAFLLSTVQLFRNKLFQTPTQHIPRVQSLYQTLQTTPFVFASMASYTCAMDFLG